MRQYNRRLFMQSLLATTAGLSMKISGAAPRTIIPEESHSHTRTWMAFGASRSIWGRKLLPEVRRNLALIANTISNYEPVSMLVKENELALAKKILNSEIELHPFEMDNLWVRDTGPTFVINGNRTACIDFNFNGRGEDQVYSKDAMVAAKIANLADYDAIAGTQALKC